MKKNHFQLSYGMKKRLKLDKGILYLKVTLNKPIPKKELLSSATLAFGEAYMDGNLQVEGDFLTMLNTVLKYKSKFLQTLRDCQKYFLI